MSNVSQNLTFLRTFLTFLHTHLLFRHTHLLFRYTSVFSIHICFFDTHLLFYLWFLRGILHICYFVTHLLFRYTSVITLHICYFKYLLLRSTHSSNLRTYVSLPPISWKGEPPMWTNNERVFPFRNFPYLECVDMLRVLAWYFLLYERPKEWELIPESVRKSVHMKITLGVLCIILPVRRIVANCWKYGYFSKHHECSHDLWAHNLIRECFGYCLLAFLQHVFLEFSYFVHVSC